VRLRAIFSIAVLVALTQNTPARTASAQDTPSAVKIHLEAPKGWAGEAIQLPPSFAPKMTWKGLEEVRFAPGMFDPKKDDFFSYVFVFYLPSQGEPNEKALQRELLTYYRGLATAVSRRKGGVDAQAFRLTLKKVEPADKSNKKQAGRFQGTLSWTEPFATMKPQKLHFEIQSAACEGREARYLAVAVSPQAPEKAKPLWKSMRDILKTVEFRDATNAKSGNDG